MRPVASTTGTRGFGALGDGPAGVVDGASAGGASVGTGADVAAGVGSGMRSGSTRSGTVVDVGVVARVVVGGAIGVV